MDELKLKYHRFLDSDEDLVLHISTEVSGLDELTSYTKHLEQARKEVEKLAESTAKNPFANLDIQKFGRPALTEEQKNLKNLQKLVNQVSKEEIVGGSSASNMKTLVSQAKAYNNTMDITNTAATVFSTLTEQMGIDGAKAFQAMVISGEKISKELKLDNDTIKDLSKTFDEVRMARERQETAEEMGAIREERSAFNKQRLDEESLSKAREQIRLDNERAEHLNKITQMQADYKQRLIDENNAQIQINKNLERKINLLSNETGGYVSPGNAMSGFANNLRSRLLSEQRPLNALGQIKTDGVFNVTNAEAFKYAFDDITNKVNDYDSVLQRTTVDTDTLNQRTLDGTRRKIEGLNRIAEMQDAYKQRLIDENNAQIEINRNLEKKMAILQRETGGYKTPDVPMSSFASGLRDRLLSEQSPMAVVGQAMNDNVFNVLNPEKFTAAFDDAKNKVDKYSFALQKAKINTNELNQETFDNARDQIATLVYEGKELEKQSNKNKKAHTSLITSLSNGFVMMIFKLRQIRAIFDGLGSMIRESFYDDFSNYIESLNLFQTAFGKGLKEDAEGIHDFSVQAEGWADRITKALYLNPSELYQYSGALYSLVKGMGVAEDVAYTMGTNLTQLAYDMTSYLNLESYQQGFEKIRSAISGQSRAVATAGVPVQLESLQELADKLGIQKTVTQMTQAEKTVMRYIALMNATADIQGDLGKTINSPENALKSFEQSIERVKIALGQLIVPIAQVVIPWLIALAQIIEEAAQKFAKFLGINIEPDYTRGTNQYAEFFDDVATSADSATGSINRSLAAFDDLNVVENNSSGSGSGGLGSNSVLNDLYKYVKGYDMLAKLQKEFGPAIDDAKKKLESIIPVLLGIATAVAAIKLVKTLGNLTTWVSGVGNAIGNIGSWFKGTSAKNVVEDSKDVKKALEAADDVGKTATKSSFGKDLKATLGKVTIGILAVAEIVTAVLVYVGVVGALMKLPGVKDSVQEGSQILGDTFLSLTKMLPALAGLTGLGAVISKIGTKEMAIGFAELALVIGGTEVLITAIGALMTIPGVHNALEEGIDATVKTFEGIGKILIPLAGLTALAAVTGLGSEVILPGLGILALIIGGTEGVMAAVGAIYNKWGDSILKGLDFIVVLFKKIGEACGSLIAGFGEAVSSALPTIGANLSGFITNAQPFFDTMKDMGPDTLNGAANLTEAITKLAGQGFINAIGTILTIKVELISIGKALKEFGPYMKSYGESISSVNADVLNASVNVITAILEYVKVANKKSLLDKIFGSKTPLKDYGEELVSFGTNFKEYAAQMAEVDVGVINKTDGAVKAVLKYAELAPKYSDFKKIFSGESDLATFGIQLVSFGESFKLYAFAVGQISDSHLAQIDKVTQSLEKLIKVANDAPTSGGIGTWIADKSFSALGAEIATFGIKFNTFSSNVKSVDTKKVDAISKFISDLISSMQTWNDSKLANALSAFGSSLVAVGNNLNTLFGNTFSTANGNSLGTTFGNAIGNKMKAAIKSKLGSTIDIKGSAGVAAATYTVKMYEGGGMPDSGDFFLANENGRAEYITSIGNRTAVANQDQMTTALATTITNAIGSLPTARQGDIIVQIGNDKVYQGQGEYQSRETDRYGTTYVKI